MISGKDELRKDELNRQTFFQSDLLEKHFKLVKGCAVTCCRAEKEIAIVNIKHNQFKQKKKLQQQAFLFSVMKKIKNALLNEKLMAIYCHSGHI